MATPPSSLQRRGSSEPKRRPCRAGSAELRNSREGAATVEAMRIVWKGLLSVCLVACGGAEVAPDAPAEVTLPSASAPIVAEATTRPSEPVRPALVETSAPTAVFPAPREPAGSPARLGDACAGTGHPSQPTCGGQGRVSATWQTTELASSSNSLPCTLKPIEPSPTSSSDIGRQIESMGGGSLCVAEDELIVYAPCFMCRMPTGDLVRARLSELTAPQHKAIAQLLGLNPPPLSAAAWRAVAKSARPTR